MPVWSKEEARAWARVGGRTRRPPALWRIRTSMTICRETLDLLAMVVRLRQTRGQKTNRSRTADEALRIGLAEIVAREHRKKN
jgi:hypothetical protein